MTINVYLRTGWAGFARYHEGLHHMSEADVLAHNLFKANPRNNVVEVRSVDRNGVETVCYALTPGTHTVDEHGQVRPIQSPIPEPKPEPRRQITTELGTIDIKPSWSAMLPIYLLMLDPANFGSDEGRAHVRSELAKMAKAADLWVEHVRGEG